MHSIRRRLMFVLAVGFAVLIGITGFSLAGVMKARVTEEFDAALEAQARALASLTEQEDGQIELDYDPAHMPEYERAERPHYFQFWLDDGQMLLRSRRLEQDLPTMPAGEPGPTIRDVTLPDGRNGRVVHIAYVPQSSGEKGEPAAEPDPEVVGPASKTRGLVVAVARGRERLDGLIASIRFWIFAIGAAATLLAVLLVWRGLAAGLKPVDTIASQVEALDAESLSARVALPRTPQELAPVVDQLNALLARLDASFERERRFTANVAHELRTPIAELRSLAEVGAKWPGDEASVVRFFEDVNEVAGRMQGVIADLLLLARCQAGVEAAASEATDLREVVTTAWSKLEQDAHRRGLRFEQRVPPDLIVESDPGKLAILFANVLGNAVSYSRPRGTIRCVGARQGSRFRLDITNPAAEPLSPAELERLTEPFWRKDESRSDARHAGLGLSVVCELAALLGLEVRFDQDRHGRFRVRLEGRALAQRQRVEEVPAPT